MDDLSAAATALRADAPAPDADGWNATADAAAVAQLKADWKKARTAYEHIEGAIAVLFPELDVSTDARYDDFIAASPDTNLFDDTGVTGIHGIERILWSDSIPDRVKTFESGLPNYVAAAFPANQQEADDFKNKLCKRLVDDIATMRSQFGPLALDVAAAYRGVIGSMNEQVEKAKKAATGEEESRYAQYTLADMRSNVDAGVETYDAFRPWLMEMGGADLDTQISAGFMTIQSAYGALGGDALPPVPATWSMTPSPADLATPFGMLFQLLESESNPAMAGSLVQSMNQSADLLGIAQLPQ
jgi:iron uptake system component EfeO